MSGFDPRQSRMYREARARFIAKAEPVCCWPDCPVEGKVVDKSLSGRHRWGPVVDHAIPFSVDPSQFWNTNLWRLFHNRCNLSKGQRTSLAGGVEPPVSVSVAELEERERCGLTVEQVAAWRTRGLYPNASRQWFAPDAYLGLPVPVPPPSWWPPS
jgi:hypothetical protein